MVNLEVQRISNNWSSDISNEGIVSSLPCQKVFNCNNSLRKYRYCRYNDELVN